MLIRMSRTSTTKPRWKWWSTIKRCPYPLVLKALLCHPVPKTNGKMLIKLSRQVFKTQYWVETKMKIFKQPRWLNNHIWTSKKRWQRNSRPLNSLRILPQEGPCLCFRNLTMSMRETFRRYLISMLPTLKDTFKNPLKKCQKLNLKEHLRGNLLKINFPWDRKKPRCGLRSSSKRSVIVFIITSSPKIRERPRRSLISEESPWRMKTLSRLRSLTKFNLVPN